MVRIATVRDAEQLSVLNDEFNGKDETTIDNIRNSIINMNFLQERKISLLNLYMVN